MREYYNSNLAISQPIFPTRGELKGCFENIYATNSVIFFPISCISLFRQSNFVLTVEVDLVIMGMLEY